MFYDYIISCYFQVNEIYSNVSEYSGCQGQGFTQGSVIFDFRITIVYEVTVSVPVNVRTL